MIKRALRYVAFAALLLAPTLAGVASAPPAFADWNTYGGCYASCTYLGLAEGHIGWSNGATKDISVSIDTVNPTSTPVDQVDWSAAGSATVRVQWTNTGTPPAPAITDWTRIRIWCWSGCDTANYTQISHDFTSTEMTNHLATLSIPLTRLVAGGGAAVLGDMDFSFVVDSPDPNLDGSGLTFDEHCACVTSYGPGTQQANAVSGSDMILRGTGAVLGQSDNSVTTNESAIGGSSFYDGVANGTTTYASATANFTASDVGKAITGTGIPASTTISSRTDASHVVLNQSVPAGSSLYFNVSGRGTFEFQSIRSFTTSWSAPSTSQLNYLSNAHRILIWSNKSPTLSGCAVEGGVAQPRWGLITHDCSGSTWTSHDSELDGYLRSLQSAAATGGTEAIYTFEHEPHDSDDANDTGHPTTDKCVIPGVGHTAGKQWCRGTASDYQAAYDRIRSRIDVACGTAPTYGQPCDRVLLSYTAVPSNMTGTDNLRPSDSDVDLWTPDPYNYFCYHDKSTSCDSASDWQSFQQTVSTSTDIMSLAKTHGKQMLFAEVGSHPGCPNGPSDPGCTSGSAIVSGTGIGAGTRASWFTAMASYLKTNTDAQRWIIGFNYFVAGTHDWKFVDYGAPTGEYRGLAEYRTGFVNDSYFFKGAVGQTAGPVWIPKNH